MQIGVLMMIFAGAFFYFLPSFIVGWTIIVIWAVANPPDRRA